jgi:hypothetical protein
VYFEAVSRDRHEISNALFTEHGHQLESEWFLNYIKCKRNPKITKLVKMSYYHMWRL